MLDNKADEQCSQDFEAKQSLSEVLSMVRGDEMQKAFDEGDFFTSEDAPVSDASDVPPFALTCSSSRNSSRRTSATCPVSWTASDVTSVDSGANCKSQDWARLSRSSLSSTKRR
jgi:hypothetical protein